MASGSCGAGTISCGGCNGVSSSSNSSGCSCGYDCSGGCSYGTSSGDGSSSCWCGTNCSGCGGCSGDCSGCSGDCSGCSGTCSSGCDGTCSGDCVGCSGDCTGGCLETCDGACKGSCDDACSGGCGHLCNVTCSNQNAKDAYEYLSQIDGLEWIEPILIEWSLVMIQEEGRRRILQKTINESLSSSESNQIGLNLKADTPNTFITVDNVKKVVELLQSNAGKNVSSLKEAIKDNFINEEFGLEIKDQSIAAYNETIPVNTTSDKSGALEGGGY